MAAASSSSSSSSTDADIYSLNTNQVDIYSLSSNSWREIQPHKGSLFYRASMVVVNGRFHWKACEIVNERHLIVTFDVSKEVFTHIQLPNIFRIVNERLYDDNDDDDEQLGWKLVTWKEDFLGLIIYPKTCAGRYFDMWVLDEYGVEKSWSKHFTFGQHTDVHKPLACKSNGEILLYKKNGQLVVYDSATRTFNIVHVQEIHSVEKFSTMLALFFRLSEEVLLKRRT